MKDLIAVQLTNIGNEEVNAVSARELYLGLGLDSSNWKRWSELNIEQNEFFTQDIDYIKLVIKTSSPNPPKDFAVSLEMAKHLAMMAKTTKAHEYRNYFIECEKATKKPLSQFEIIAQIALASVEMEKRQLALEQEVKTLTAKVTATPTDYFTIAGYAALKGKNVSVHEARMLGHEASKLSRQYEYPISKAHSEIFGSVNTYHIDILTKIVE